MPHDNASKLHGIFIHPFLPLTLDQATEIVSERSNGYYNPSPNLDEVTEFSHNVEVCSEWCLDELEALSIVLRHKYNVPSQITRRPSSVEGNDPIFGHPIDTAEDILSGSPLHQVDGYSSGKGGRVWIDGRWSIYSLEHLCTALRKVAGDSARSAIDSLVTREWMEVSQHLEYTAAGLDTSSLLWQENEMKWLNSCGINMGAVPRLRSLFDEHKAKGWSLPRIVSAANRYTIRGTTATSSVTEGGVTNTVSVSGPETIILPNPRHGGLMFKNAKRLLDGLDMEAFSKEDQGFIDQHENFHTRDEAWIIASLHGQILREEGGRPGRLYSEHLY